MQRIQNRVARNLFYKSIKDFEGLSGTELSEGDQTIKIIDERLIFDLATFEATLNHPSLCLVPAEVPKQVQNRRCYLTLLFCFVFFTGNSLALFGKLPHDAEQLLFADEVLIKLLLFCKYEGKELCPLALIVLLWNRDLTNLTD